MPSKSSKPEMGVFGWVNAIKLIVLVVLGPIALLLAGDYEYFLLCMCCFGAIGIVVFLDRRPKGHASREWFPNWLGYTVAAGLLLAMIVGVVQGITSAL